MLSYFRIYLLIGCAYFIISPALAQQSRFAKQPASSIKLYALNIGEKLPKGIQLNNVNNYSEGVIKLDSLTGKVIILDFWATWCGSCIEGFPKMDALQREFGDQLQVILVNANQTGDTKQKVDKLFQSRKQRVGYEVTLPYLLGDTILQELFPHKYIPHYVWINGDGVVVATTFAKEVTRGNVSTLINRGSISLHNKKDLLSHDPSLPLFNDAFENLGASIKLSAVFTGYIEGAGFKMGIQDPGKDSARLYLLNHPLDLLYRRAFSLKQPNNQLIFDSVDVEFKQAFLDQKNYENKYCYELIAPGRSTGEMLQFFQEDLVRQFRIKAQPLLKRVDVLVLKPSTALVGLITKGEQPALGTEVDEVPGLVRNYPISSLVSVLNAKSSIPIINETGFKDRIDLQLPGGYELFSEIQMENFLRSKGFGVVKEKRDIEFVLFKKR
ncbi:MAG: TlpA family protein disulfide reductase [Sphingobacteriales bacterium]|nr:TlpA family protein disulfide reductase [Sphingobacteriales bacterium]OJW01972.1 MAG: hypothetical protein BGO52_00375 [Sphingobacteriales bacterium 44-61]